MSLKSYHSEHVFRIMNIIKLQTSRETFVTLFLSFYILSLLMFYKFYMH